MIVLHFMNLNSDRVDITRQVSNRGLQLGNKLYAEKTLFFKNRICRFKLKALTGCYTPFTTLGFSFLLLSF